MGEEITNLKTLFSLGAMIGQMFRPNCEVAISDLSVEPGKIVFIYNGKVTGRKVGDRLNHETQGRLKDKNHLKHINYRKSIETVNKEIKSSTQIINIGGIDYSFCINYDCTLDRMLQNQLNSFLYMQDDPIEPKDHILDKNMNYINDIVEKELTKFNLSKDDLRKEDRLLIIENLYLKKIFELDKSVLNVANVLNVSRYTIYNDLKEIEKNNLQQNS